MLPCFSVLIFTLALNRYLLMIFLGLTCNQAQANGMVNAGYISD